MKPHLVVQITQHIQIFDELSTRMLRVRAHTLNNSMHAHTCMQVIDRDEIKLLNSNKPNSISTDPHTTKAAKATAVITLNQQAKQASYRAFVHSDGTKDHASS